MLHLKAEKHFFIRHSVIFRNINHAALVNRKACIENGATTQPKKKKKKRKWSSEAWLQLPFDEGLKDPLHHFYPSRIYSLGREDVLFITGDWNAKVGSQKMPGVTGKFGLGVQNEARQRLTEFCQENTLVIANTLFQQHKRRLYAWASPDGQHQN